MTANSARTEYFYQLARQDGAREQAGYNSGSGTDCAEAPFYAARRKVWIALADGTALETALEAFDREWRTYATENNAKVAAAPKIKRKFSPSAGLSSIHHRWVSPDKASGSGMVFIRTMAEKAPQE